MPQSLFSTICKFQILVKSSLNFIALFLKPYDSRSNVLKDDVDIQDDEYKIIVSDEIMLKMELECQNGPLFVTVIPLPTYLVLVSLHVTYFKNLNLLEVT